MKPTLLPSEPLMAAVQYYQRHRDALFRFIDDPDLPIDNSATEREFQNVAKLRLNMLFAGSTEGAHRACVLLGIVATCRLFSPLADSRPEEEARAPRKLKFSFPGPRSVAREPKFSFLGVGGVRKD